MKHRMLIGIDRKVYFPFFFLKTILLAVITTFFFIPDIPGKLPLLLIIAVLNIVLLRRACIRFFKFLLISSTIITVVWFFLVYVPEAKTISSAVMTMWKAPAFRNAQTRLWGLFLSGQLYLGITSRYEILVSLRRVHAGVQVSLFVVVLFNAVSYFIQSFQDISESFAARIPGKHTLRDRLYILNSLTFDAFRVIFECRKIFFLSQARVYSSLGDISHSSAIPVSTAQHIHIAYQNVCYPNSKSVILNRIDFELEPGITLIMGANGSGKSTLLNLISGIIPAVIPAQYVEKAGLSEELKHSLVGYVPQGNEISFFYDTVDRVLCHLPDSLTHIWLDRFGLLYLTDGEHALSDLSAGECKAIALIAELLDTQHNICLLDEPSAFLSEDFKQQLFKMLHEVGSTGKRILVATHDMEMIQIANQVIYLQDGVLTRKTASKPLPPPHIDKSLHLRKKRPIMTLCVPQPLLPNAEPDEYDKGERYRLVFSSFDRIGFYGGNGAGKTTLGRYIQKNSRGIRSVMMWQALEKQFFSSTVIDELLVGKQHSHQAYEEALQALKALEMEHLSDRPPQFLSGGEKRILIALCLIMQHPDLLILDEVFDSVDAHRSILLAKFINQYQQQSGCCCIFIDQDISPIDSSIDRIYTIRNFRIEE